MIELEASYIGSIVRHALHEDVGHGDITTLLTVPADAMSDAVFVAKQPGVVAGLAVAQTAFSFMDPAVTFDALVADGATVSVGDTIATVSGPSRGILTAERVALNFLQRACGVASLTRRYVDLVAGTKARILDTRKTTPGLRRLEKYAVTVGGGTNHRFGLDDGILIKDNHIAAAGGVVSAVMAAKRAAPHTLKIECEVTDLDQLEKAVKAGADAVLLDNMSLEMLRESVEFVAGRVTTEASGGVNESTVAAIAATGVDLISVGALTHSAPAMDISLQFR